MFLVHRGLTLQPHICPCVVTTLPIKVALWPDTIAPILFGFSGNWTKIPLVKSQCFTIETRNIHVDGIEVKTWYWKLALKSNLQWQYQRVSLQHIISRISKCNYNFPFNWNVPILVGNDHWPCQEAVYTNKPHFSIMSSIFEFYGKGVTLWGNYR